MRITRRSVLSALAASASATLARGQSGWISLLDGVSLKGWQKTPYAHAGPVAVRDGVLLIGRGRLTGVRWPGDFPRQGYEIRFEAARLEGNDYFSITFPVGRTYCEWVNGGWGGDVVGLSNLDGNDASENDTSTLLNFIRGRWYAFRLVVQTDLVQGWIDGNSIFAINPAQREVGLRFGESDLATPLGFSSYGTQAGFRKIEYRTL